MQEMVCRGCGNEFTSTNGMQSYCKKKCQRDAAIKRAKVKSLRRDFLDDAIPTGTIGAIHELVVCADLMRKGFHVFRAQSPSCPCDLIYMKGKELVRVEVRTGHRLEGGRLSYPLRLNPDFFDVLAVVLYTGEIIYLSNTFAAMEL